MSSSEATTRDIRVSVQSQYDPSRSSPQQSQWFFLYTVKITNEGRDTVQLISRHWVITDGMGKVEEVHRAWGGWKSAGFGARAEFRVHLRVPAHDAVWIHARDLSDD